jgi:hypothetical protein
MSRIGFWQLLLDDKMSWWEAQRINEATESAEYATALAGSASTAAANHHTRINQMSREIVMLRTALTVLTQTLKDSKVLDERLLDLRLQTALEEAEAMFPKPPKGPTSMNEALKQPMFAANAAALTCLRCRKQVPASSTLMTADGPMCERCPT